MGQNHITILAACLFSAVAIAIVSAVPLPANDKELDVLQIPLTNGKEIDVLTIGSKDQDQLIADRNKRTIGLLRELFPDITKEIDGIVNRIIAQVIRVVGPTLLPTLFGGNRPVTQPNNDDFDDDDDDDDDDDFAKDTDNEISSSDTKSTSSSSSSSNSEGGTRVELDLPTFAPDTNSTKNGATDTTIDLSAINKQLEETIRVARQVKEAEAAAQAIAALTQQQQQPQKQEQQSPSQLPIPQQQTPSSLKPLAEQTIQLSFNNEVTSTNDNLKPINNDLQLSESKSPAIDELTLDSNEDTADLDDRNKRFLTLGGGGLAGGSSGGSSGSASSSGAGGGAPAGGSGNFLFDIIRLFSGSVQTQTGDEAANSANSVSGGDGDSDGDSDSNRTADGYTEGIPGPITRLVVLANRGLANLIQDLILRIAATSEKFVNFKAKLITALI